MNKQTDFLQDMPAAKIEMVCSAVITGPNDCYRVELRRIWDDTKPLLVVCMLNPSTADSRINDPTILTLIHFGKLWGYGGLLVVNLRSFRSSKPEDMYAARDSEGPDNHDYIRAALRYAHETKRPALAAWGNAKVSAEKFMREAEIWNVDLICLGTTLSGQPKHPLARGLHRVPRDQQPILWKANQ